MHLQSWNRRWDIHVLDIVNAFEKACGKEIPYEIKPRRAGDIATCYCDAVKSKERARTGLQNAESTRCVRIHGDGRQ